MKTIALITLYNPGCVGMRYVASSLKTAGHRVFIINFKELRATYVPSSDKEQQERLRKTKVLYLALPHPGKIRYLPYPTPITETEKSLLVNELREKIKPDLIAFSFYSVTYEVSRELTELIHTELPDVSIMWGGLHCIVAQAECIQTADIVCTGEGEDATVELLEHWDEYKDRRYLKIPGLWFRDKKGEITRNPERPPITDLDRLPFPLYGENEILIEDDAISDKMSHPGDFLNAHIYIFTERGCPYRCSYCIHSILREHGYASFRRRSVDNVMAEVRDRIERFGIRHMIFHDEIFIINKEWIREFAGKFRTQFYEPLGITFTGYVHPLTTDADMLDWMVKAGMTRTGMGIQSGSEYINTEIFDRPYCPKETIAMAHLLHKYDFDLVQYEILVNNPFESEEDRQKTFDLLMKLPPPFFTETFGLYIYKYSKLAEKPLPPQQPDEKELLFYNMLYHLTGLRIISRERIRALSHDTYLREHPEELEALAVDLVKAECEITHAQRNLAAQNAELETLRARLRSLEPETYPLKAAVKKKIKRIFYPLFREKF